MVCEQKNRIDQFDKILAEQSKMIQQLQANKLDACNKMPGNLD